MNKVLIIIPARSQSKRVKNKNIRKVKNKPLIYWTIRYAKKYFKNNDIIVSSDSRIIKKISQNEKVLFDQRPKSLSSDKSKVYRTIIHVIQKFNVLNKYSYIALLQPTSPIRPKNIINKGINVLKRNKKFENLIHLEKTNYNIGAVNNNEWTPIRKDITRTQDIVNQYRPSGCLFLYKMKNIENYKLFQKRKIFGFKKRDTIETVNIDEESDFNMLKYLLKKNLLRL
jgi:CMP-N,N'-diacetyllegionaminic acid synthase